MNIVRLNTAPATFAPETIYFVAPDGAPTCTMVVSGQVGEVKLVSTTDGIGEVSGFSVRSDFVTWAATAFVTAGTVIDVGPLSYSYNGVATEIADLPGWLPHGTRTPMHYGNNVGTGNGATDRAAIQAMMNAQEALGGGIVEFPTPLTEYTLELAIQWGIGVTAFPANATRFRCTGSGRGKKFPIYGCVIGGGAITSEVSAMAVYPLNAISIADGRTITLTNPAHAANVAVGDVIQPEDTRFYLIGEPGTSGELPRPLWAQMNVVTAVNPSTGAITLRHPVNNTTATAQLRQMTTTNVLLNGAGEPTNYKIRGLRDACMIGGTWIADSDGGGFMGDGGMIDCTFLPHRVEGATGPGYGNNITNCRVGCDILISRRYGIEFGQQSNGNTAEFGVMEFALREIPGPHSAAVTLGEGSYNNKITVTEINLGSNPFINVVWFLNAMRNSVDVGIIRGVPITGSVVAYSTYNFTGTYNKAEHNKVTIGHSEVDCQRYASVSLNANHNTLQGRFFGAVSFGGGTAPGSSYLLEGDNNAILDGSHFANGAPSDLGTGNVVAGVGSAVFSDAAFIIQDNADPTKQAKLDASGITAGATRLYILPDINGTFALLNAPQTFTNNNTFSGAFHTVGSATAAFGTSAAASIVTFGAGGTTTGLTKELRIGTGGLSGSITSITIGPVAVGAIARVILNNVPTFADNAAALSGGLVVNTAYKTATGELRIVV